MKKIPKTIHPYLIKAILADKDPQEEVRRMVDEEDIKEWANTEDHVPACKPFKVESRPWKITGWARFKLILP